MKKILWVMILATSCAINAQQTFHVDNSSSYTVELVGAITVNKNYAGLGEINKYPMFRSVGSSSFASLSYDQYLSSTNTDSFPIWNGSNEGSGSLSNMWYYREESPNVEIGPMSPESAHAMSSGQRFYGVKVVVSGLPYGEVSFSIGQFQSHYEEDSENLVRVMYQESGTGDQVNYKIRIEDF